MKFYPTSLTIFLTSALTLSPIIADDSQVDCNVTQELTHLKRQTEENNKKIQKLESRLNNRDCKPAARLPEQCWPATYMEIPGTNSAIKFILNPNLALSYDFESYPTDILYPPFVALKGVQGNADKKGQFFAQGKATQFGFKTISHTNLGEIKTEVSLDFWGQNFTILPSNLFYQARLRYGYVELCNFTIGQTVSTFLDIDSIGESVDYGAIDGVSFRHGLIRYKFHLTNKVTLDVAMERPATDYTAENGALYSTGSATSFTPSQPSSGVAGGSGMPDLTFQLRHTHNQGHVALRGVLRELKIRDVSDLGVVPVVNNSFKTTGWGLGVSGKYLFYKKSNFFLHVNYGDGVGRYIVILNGQAVFYDRLRRIFDRQKASDLIVGVEHFWTGALRSNLIFAQSNVNVSKFTPILTGATRVSKRYRQTFVNLIYSPIPAIDMGLEFGLVDRKTVDLKYGKAKRIIAGFTYRL